MVGSHVDSIGAKVWRILATSHRQEENAEGHTLQLQAASVGS